MTAVWRALSTTAVVLSLAAALPMAGRAQAPASPKRVLVLYWYDREFATDIDFDRLLQAHLRTSLGTSLDYYIEYLDANRFPGENQSALMRDYLRQKYAGRLIDVVITNTPVPLDFLLKYRDTLFPQAKIVFANIDYPAARDLKAGPGATGIVYKLTHKETVELALKLHPNVKQVFVISGTLNHDRSFEMTARRELAGYHGPANIEYLTDLSAEDLTRRVANLPRQSVILYIRQFTNDRTGRVYEIRDSLRLIMRAAQVPVYVMAEGNLEHGAVGGYVWTVEGNAAKVAELALRIMAGTPAAQIPVERAPSVPMFDWRALKRWGIRENRLPPGAVIRFRQASLWEQYKWRIVLGVAVLVLQMLLIGALLVERRHVRRSADGLRKAQEILRESEERFRSLANTAPVMIAVTDSLGFATFFNKTWLTFTGRTMEQEVGDGWPASIHPDDREESLSKIRISLEERSECRLEYRLRRADGQYRTVMCRGIPRFEAGERYVGHVASIVDITDLTQALANQKLESLGVLTSGIAHDFNNFLGGILASVELMLSDFTEAPATRKIAEQIRGMTIRAAEIVRQLMAYAGEEDTAFEPIDLADLVREMQQFMAVAISKNAALELDIPAGLPPMLGNPAQIRQVVMNLITNASDALRGAHGTIAIAMSLVMEPQDHNVREMSVERALRLEVRDSGCGMTDEIQRRIFDPFFSTKGAGRGMGLAAVQGIVHSHGGIVQVRSTPGEGSCFEILLPCAHSIRQPLPAAKHEITAAAEPSAGTILIVDDEEALRSPIAKILRKRGFFVLEAGDGVAGVELYRRHVDTIRAVLLDLTLPGLSGTEVLAELRKMRTDVKVILATAYGRARALQDVEQPELVSYLRKPYEISQLLDLLRKLCSFDSPRDLPRPAAASKLEHRA